MHRLIFDFPTTDGTPLRRVFTQPREILRADHADDVIPVLQAVEQATSAGAWAAGFLTYEAAPAFEPAMRVAGRRRMPLVWFGVFDGVSSEPAAGAAAHLPVPELAFEADTSTARYRAAIHTIHEAIAAGETYQVNYTLRLRATLPSPRASDNVDVDASARENDDADSLHGDALYAALRAAQGAGYHADLDIGSFRILSASPELFFQRRGSRITTRPMKGTRPRGRFGAEDDALAHELATSPKERAENLMIVDLLRNDLGRIARTGTVRVPSMFTLERYHTVLQMTSTIEAELRAGCGLVDVFGALFPCGSVTGAPKINTMRIIAALEDAPREVYCGAIGFVEPGGDCTFNVPIRTLWLDRERRLAEYGAGSGVTSDAVHTEEHAEISAKTLVLQTAWPDFALIETLRLERGTLVRLDAHLARMAASCAYFVRPFPGAALRAALEALAASLPHARRRVRVELRPDARFTIAAERLATQGTTGAAPRDACVDADADELTALPVVRLAPEGVDARDVFLFHKTTHRVVHERARAAAPDAFDVLLWNQAGDVTEFTRGNVVVQIDGELRTPPQRAGLLAGCLRGELLAAGAIVERDVAIRDLARAERIWFVNSLRGWIEVRIAASAVPVEAATSD